MNVGDKVRADDISLGSSESSRCLSPLNPPIRSPDPSPRACRSTRHSQEGFLENHIDPLSISPAESPAQYHVLSFRQGLSLVVGLQIGSGIFSSPGQVSTNAGSPGASLLIWLFSGLLTSTGASCYAELGTRIPRNGGTQAYLATIFGPVPAFMFTWTAITILKPGSLAIISLVLGEYVVRGLGFEYSLAINRFIAILVVAIITLANAYSSRLGASMSTFFFGVKLAILLVIVIVGVTSISRFDHDGALHEGWFAGSSNSVSGYATALYGGLWAYDGWDNLNYVSAEMRDPKRDLPRTIFMAMVIVITAYLMANWSYFIVLSKQQMDTSSSVVLTMMQKVFGTPGSVVSAFFVALSCLGALNASIYSAVRLVKAAADDSLIPELFGSLSGPLKMPITSSLLVFVLVSIYILLGEFASLTTLYGACSYMFYLWSVIGLMVMKFKKKESIESYQVWFMVPLIFTIVAIFLVVRAAMTNPAKFLGLLGFIFLSVPFYIIRNRCLSATLAS